MIYHDLEVLLPSQFDQCLALSSCTRKGLLHEYMLAIFQRSLCQFIVSPHGRDHSYRIDIGGSNQFRCLGGDLNARIGLLGTMTCSLACFRDIENPGAIEIREVSYHVWAPIAVADYAEVHGFVTTLSVSLYGGSVNWRFTAKTGDISNGEALCSLQL